MLDDNLRLILEKHTPLHSCRVPINRNDPWYDATKSQIIGAHRQWAERQYIRYPTILNKQQFNKAKASMVKIMHEAKSKFHLSEINSATSNEFVCHMQQTIRLEKLAPFPNSKSLIYQVPAILMILFINKAKLIRTSIHQHKHQTQNSTTQTSLTIFDSSHPVTITQLHTIINCSKPTSCDLYPIPTSLLLECLDDILQHSPISLALHYCQANFRLI